MFAVLATLTVIIVSFATYLFVQKSPTDKQDEDDLIIAKQDDQENSAANITTVAPIEQKKLVPSDVRSQIISAIFSENYSNLSNLMTEVVTVRIEGQDCCGEIIYTEAIKKLDELRGGGSWSFIDSDLRIGKLKTHAPRYYVEHNAIVGVSDSGYSVSFQLNDMGRINAITLSRDYNLGLQ